jgi:glutamate 5-kinase
MLSTYSGDQLRIVFGEGSKVGRGGMSSKVDSAAWAFRKGIAVVVASGLKPGCISDIIAGKPVGTFFTDEPDEIAPPGASRE